MVFLNSTFVVYFEEKRCKQLGDKWFVKHTMCLENDNLKFSAKKSLDYIAIGHNLQSYVKFLWSYNGGILKADTRFCVLFEFLIFFHIKIHEKIHKKPVSYKAHACVGFQNSVRASILVSYDNFKLLSNSPIL